MDRRGSGLRRKGSGCSRGGGGARAPAAQRAPAAHSPSLSRSSDSFGSWRQDSSLLTPYSAGPPTPGSAASSGSCRNCDRLKAPSYRCCCNICFRTHGREHTDRCNSQSSQSPDAPSMPSIGPPAPLPLPSAWKQPRALTIVAPGAAARDRYAGLVEDDGDSPVAPDENMGSPGLLAFDAAVVGRNNASGQRRFVARTAPPNAWPTKIPQPPPAGDRLAAAVYDGAAEQVKESTRAALWHLLTSTRAGSLHTRVKVALGHVHWQPEASLQRLLSDAIFRADDFVCLASAGALRPCWEPGIHSAEKLHRVAQAAGFVRDDRPLPPHKWRRWQVYLQRPETLQVRTYSGDRGTRRGGEKGARRCGDMSNVDHELVLYLESKDDKVHVRKVLRKQVVPRLVVDNCTASAAPDNLGSRLRVEQNEMVRPEDVPHLDAWLRHTSVRDMTLSFAVGSDHWQTGMLRQKTREEGVWRKGTLKLVRSTVEETRGGSRRTLDIEADLTCTQLTEELKWTRVGGRRIGFVPNFERITALLHRLLAAAAQLGGSPAPPSLTDAEIKEMVSDVRRDLLAWSVRNSTEGSPYCDFRSEARLRAHTSELNSFAEAVLKGRNECEDDERAARAELLSRKLTHVEQVSAGREPFSPMEVCGGWTLQHLWCPGGQLFLNCGALVGMARLRNVYESGLVRLSVKVEATVRYVNECEVGWEGVREWTEDGVVKRSHVQMSYANCGTVCCDGRTSQHKPFGPGSVVVAVLNLKARTLQLIVDSVSQTQHKIPGDCVSFVPTVKILNCAVRVLAGVGDDSPELASVAPHLVPERLFDPCRTEEEELRLQVEQLVLPEQEKIPLRALRGVISGLTCDTGMNSRDNIGTGSFGSVYLCKLALMPQGSSGELLAVKELREDAAPSAPRTVYTGTSGYTNGSDRRADSAQGRLVLRLRMHREIINLKGQHNTNILRLQGWAERSDRTLYLIAEYCSGGQLRDFLQTVSLTPDQRVAISVGVGTGIGNALNWLHACSVAGDVFVHLDVAPRNVLLVETQEGGFIDRADDSKMYKLGDFGIMAVEGQPVQELCPALAPPEVLRLPQAEWRASPSFDVWSFGILHYEILFGIPYDQFTGRPLTDLIRAVVDGLRPQPPPPRMLQGQAGSIWEVLSTQCWACQEERPPMVELLAAFEKQRAQRSTPPRNRDWPAAAAGISSSPHPTP
eukprot:TRINITY_DN32284_c0_g1_i1.p1 TRINITY_DN32284_c0_g1~~TRINITY_DN32284_c0_g1_i1.p1  ORF type:complete len:1198 (+),score=92.89 TRINITY_DN32284_c0_g1_i1:58-3651(+)